MHYYNALLINRAPVLISGGKSDEMKKELETAIALDPQLANAYSLLAYAQTFSGEPEKGLATMKKALELFPRNEIFQINLADIYMENRKVDAAIALSRALAGSGNPEVARRAKTVMAQAEKIKEQSLPTVSGPKSTYVPEDATKRDFHDPGATGPAVPGRGSSQCRLLTGNNFGSCLLKRVRLMAAAITRQPLLCPDE